MRCYQSVCLLLLAAAAAPAPAPDGASYGAPPLSNGGLGGGFGAGSVRGPAAGFRGGLDGGSAGRPSGGFGGGFDGGSGGRPSGGFRGGLGGGSGGRPSGGFGGGLGGGTGGRPNGGFGGGLDGGPGGQSVGGFGGGRGAGSARRGALIEPVGPGLRPDGLPIGPGTPYSFSWAVDEPEYGNQYGHTQESDGVVTQGEYRVLLPDGRTQIVTYSVEGDSGFQAQVTYEGEVQLTAAGRPGPPAAFDGPGRAPAVPGRGRGGSGRGRGGPGRGRGGSGVRPPVGDGRVTRLGAGLTIPPRLALQRGSPFPFGTDGGTEQQTEDRPSTSYGY